MLTIDLHGMLVNQALKTLEKAIKDAPKGTEHIRVIHGHHHGDAIRQMVRDPNQLRSRRLIRRKQTKNPGETILVIDD